jgi:hypothetical protein
MNKRAGILIARVPGFALLVFLIVALAFLSGCTGKSPPASPAPVPDLTPGPHAGISWKEMPLSDLRGRGNFSISGFSGSTVIVPVFSVSCPSCIPLLRRQIDEAGHLATEDPGRIIVVALDTDPDTGPDFLTAYGSQAAFTGYLARSPEAMNLDLFQRFGPFALDTTTVPVILVCPDGHDLLLPPGIKIAEDLNETLAREC